MSRPGSLAGRTAIVTGAGRGLGRAIAELFGREGARVVVASRSAHGCAAAVEAIESAGGTAIAKPTNIGTESDVVDMVGFVVETYGSLDILVNNAKSWGTRASRPACPSRRRSSRSTTRSSTGRSTPGSAERSGRCRPRSRTCASVAAGSSTSRPCTA